MVLTTFFFLSEIHAKTNTDDVFDFFLLFVQNKTHLVDI
jgi:hypothetical protein